jgi:hypothetical protein
MSTLNERKAVIYKPGDVVYADSNGQSGENYFGVVVDRDFWFREIEKEDVILPAIEEYKKNGVLYNRIPLRVLGTKFFRQYWKTNDDEFFEPEDKVVMSYRAAAPTYTSEVDLRPIIELCGIDNNRVGKLLFNDANTYALDSLRDAKIVYDYLDGARFDSSEKYVFKKDKLLRLLEQAVPIR